MSADGERSPLTSSPPPPRTRFQSLHSFHARAQRSAELMQLYPNSVVLLCELEDFAIAASAETQSQMGCYAARTESTGVAVPTPAAAAASTQTTRSSRRTKTTTNLRPNEIGLFSARIRVEPHGVTGAGQTPQAHPISSRLETPRSISNTSRTGNTELICVLSRENKIADLILLLRSRLVIDSSQGIYPIAGTHHRVLLPTSQAVGDAFDQYKDADGYLYILYTVEKTFG